MRPANSKHELNSALIGMILADGSMNSEKILYLRHGGKQLDYVNEKAEYLSNYLTPRSLRDSVDKKGYAYRYAYYNDSSLKFLHRKIYKDKKKVISPSILHRINAISLAFIYMDDGCLSLRKDKQKEGFYKSREIHLNVQSFTKTEVIALQTRLKNKFGVEFRLTTDKGKPRLWCNTKNTIKFLEIVAPIVRQFPSMHYKLDLKYHKKDISFLN